MRSTKMCNYWLIDWLIDCVRHCVTTVSITRWSSTLFQAGRIREVPWSALCTPSAALYSWHYFVVHRIYLSPRAVWRLKSDGLQSMVTDQYCSNKIYKGSRVRVWSLPCRQINCPASPMDWRTVLLRYVKLWLLTNILQKFLHWQTQRLKCTYSVVPTPVVPFYCFFPLLWSLE